MLLILLKNKKHISIISIITKQKYVSIITKQRHVSIIDMLVLLQNKKTR